MRGGKSPKAWCLLLQGFSPPEPPPLPGLQGRHSGTRHGHTGPWARGYSDPTARLSGAQSTSGHGALILDVQEENSHASVSYSSGCLNSWITLYLSHSKTIAENGIRSLLYITHQNGVCDEIK